MQHFKPVKILLVDDDEGDIEITKRGLENHKVKVDIAVCHDGLEAMEYLRDENNPKPDLILLDLNMPKVDGRETLQMIRNEESIKQIPVIILTTSQNDQDIIKSYKLGCNCYVAKPVGIDEFHQILRVLEDFWFTIVRLPTKMN